MNEAVLEKIRTGDINQSLEKYKKLAKLGNTDAYFILGYLYEFGGKDLEPNDNEAEFWYKKSFNEIRDYDSLVALARVFLYMKRDPVNAYKLYKKLESKNIPIVHLSLGKIHELGQLGSVDIEKAKFFYKKSYDLGNLYGGLFYTGLFFRADSSNSLMVGLLAFFKHQWLRFRIFLISIRDKSNWRIKQV